MAGARPLILTRPQAQSEAFARVLTERLPGRFDPIVAPLIAITPLAGPIDLAGVQGLVFTSANGVEQFAARTGDRALPAFCVGAMTADAARRAGFTTASADGDVAALAALVLASFRPGEGDFLHLRGRHAAGDLVGRLAAAGVPARAAEIYDQIPTHLAGPAREVLAAGRAATIAFFSPRSARLFSAEAGAAGWYLGSSTAVSLSAAADAELEAHWEKRVIAPAPTREGMLQALASSDQTTA